MIFHFVIAFISGILVKSVDWLEDDKKSKNPVKFLLALIYGILIGYIIGNTSFSMIFLAALVAQVLARKIDTSAHRLGFATALVVALFFEIPTIIPLFFGYFLVLAFLDEVDFVGKLRWLETYRPILPIGALPLVFFGMPEYFFGILVFDIGYLIFAYFIKK
jgi:hypothetical protein